MNESWLQRLIPRPEAPGRLFCFAHAGGSAALYRLWPRRLDRLEVCAIQLPGRANRLNEPPVGSIAALVEALLPSMLPLLDRPYAFFGHSMGSLLATALAHRLAAIGQRLPAHLFVSGRHPPHMPSPETSMRALSDDEFVVEINRRYSGLPPEVMEHPELVELMLPALRADIEAIETFRPAWSRPLPCPITAYGGDEDHCTPRPHLEAWREATSASFRVRMFPGDHFYLDECLDGVLDDVSATIAPALAATPA